VICGVVDPAGVDPAEVARAAGPGAVVRSYGAAVLAWHPGPRVHVSLDAVAVLVHGRVDGVAAPPGTSAGSSLAGLAHAVATRDWPVLDAVAADFAAVRYDPDAGTLDLTRDAAGSVPLYWGRRGGRIAFGTHPSLPVALGAASGGADPAVLRAFLADRSVAGAMTGVRGVARVVGGRVLSLPRAAAYRWFRPDRVAVSDEPLAAHASRVAAAVTSAVASRVSGGRAMLLLSGGHDSGAVAAAAARAGVALDCVTQRFSDGGAEWPLARDLALGLGHAWRAIDIDDGVTAADLRALARLAATPVGYAGPQLALATRAAAHGADVVLDGGGGDLLFAAGTVAAAELARRGRVAAAWRTARDQAARQQPPGRAVLKAGVRAALPAPLLRVRERLRRPAPWVVGPVPATAAHAPRSERADLLAGLLRLGADHDAELAVRLVAPAAYARPLLDRRVIDAALALPLAARLPVPRVKPALGALLGPYAATRTHEVMERRWAVWTEAAREALPALVTGEASLARQGFLRNLPSGAVPADRLGAVLSAVAAEAWLGEEARDL
jgi:asparagine synthetase B (glutamine-hydrolysing)